MEYTTFQINIEVQVYSNMHDIVLYTNYTIYKTVFAYSCYLYMTNHENDQLANFVIRHLETLISVEYI